MTGITIGNDRGEVIDLWTRIFASDDGRGAFFVLATVMMQLGPNELIA